MFRTKFQWDRQVVAYFCSCLSVASRIIICPVGGENGAWRSQGGWWEAVLNFSFVNTGTLAYWNVIFLMIGTEMVWTTWIKVLVENNLVCQTFIRGSIRIDGSCFIQVPKTASVMPSPSRGPATTLSHWPCHRETTSGFRALGYLLLLLIQPNLLSLTPSVPLFQSGWCLHCFSDRWALPAA